MPRFAAVRAIAGRVLAGGLCIAAAAAVFALLSESWDETDTNVIGTSLCFAAASGTAAAGASAYLRPARALRLLGAATVLASIVAFVLFAVAVWTELRIWAYEDIWRICGCVGVLAIAGAHACLLLGSRRERDTRAVRLITSASVVLAVVDAGAIILPLLRLIDQIDEDWARFFGVALVLLMLTSVLPALLRLESSPELREAA